MDKYSGKISYNLFGIKGKGPNGSVTYNTWEVYNGKTYYVDADFRAYNSVQESWTDHKSFLLNSDRYEPYLLEILNNRGYTEEDIEKLSYKNFYRIIEKIMSEI